VIKLWLSTITDIKFDKLSKSDKLLYCRNQISAGVLPQTPQETDSTDSSFGCGWGIPPLYPQCLQYPVLASKVSDPDLPHPICASRFG